jgi:acyl-CoA synthetase (AMP-forming)/AMP-acid ligase II/acyl carrier protein
MPEEPQTLAQALQSQVEGRGGVTFLDGDNRERSFSYPVLCTRALRLLHFFQHAGVRPEDELVLHVANNSGFIDALWACLLGGIVPVPLAQGSKAEHRRKLLAVMTVLRRPVLFTDRKHFERLILDARGQGLQSVLDVGRVVFLEDITVGQELGIQYAATPDDVALVQFSSGSTGDPKGVVLTHRNILHNIRSIRDAAYFSSDDSTMSWMPLTHDMGLIGFHLLPATLGMQQYIFPTELFTRRPLDWLEKVSDKRVTAISSPNFGYLQVLRSLDRSRPRAFDLSNVRLIFNGAEPISATLCRRFLNAFAAHGLRGAAMFPVYGLAEATLAVAFPATGLEMAVIHVERAFLNVGDAVRLRSVGCGSTISLVSVGVPLAGTLLRISDDSGSALAVGHVGHVQICGDSVTAGYYRSCGVSREGFTVDGWLNTGDLGTVVEGQLFIVGRSKETIIVNGQNFHPHDLEWICERCADVPAGKIACTAIRRDDDGTDDVAVFVQHRRPLEEFVRVAMRIKEAIRCATGLSVGEVIPVQSLPRTTSGKIQRFALRDGFHRGLYADSLAALHAKVSTVRGAHPPPLSMLEQSLKEIVDSAMRGGDIGRDDNLLDNGADSLVLTTILLDLEDRYGEAPGIEDFLQYPTIAAMAGFLEKNFNARPSVVERLFERPSPLGPEPVGGVLGNGAL